MARQHYTLLALFLIGFGAATALQRNHQPSTAALIEVPAKEMPTPAPRSVEVAAGRVAEPLGRWGPLPPVAEVTDSSADALAEDAAVASVLAAESATALFAADRL